MMNRREYHPAYLCTEDDDVSEKDLSPFWLSHGYRIMTPWIFIPNGELIGGDVIDTPKNWMII